MAVDKLVDSTQLDSDLTSVANAIRTKGGTSAQLAFPADFVQAIEDIETGGGGEWTTEDVARNLAPNGRIELTGNITIENSALTRKPITSLFAPNARISNSGCAFCTSLKTAVYKDFSSNDNLRGCTSLEAVDCRGGLTANCFNSCTSLTVLVIRSVTLVSLNNINALTNSPFASGKAGGTLYVPQSLISSYQSATNWSTILGYANNQIKSIESTHTDPDAPIDLTLYYVDGTPIPTA